MATKKRLIDVYEAIERARASDNIVGSSIWETSEVVGFLEDCPIEDSVEVVHGRWIEHPKVEIVDGKWISNYECSECCCFYRTHENYCGYCGAKMDLNGE